MPDPLIAAAWALAVAMETSNAAGLNLDLADAHLPLVEVLEPLLRKVVACDTLSPLFSVDGACCANAVPTVMPIVRTANMRAILMIRFPSVLMTNSISTRS
jgi:predicted tellurium resistance membrane protein TerC